MLQATLISIFERDLNKLSIEIESYKQEENSWLKGKEISNSAGNLALHILGNLNWFIGSQLGETGFVRQRELEFSATCSKSELLHEISKTKAMIHATLEKITEDDLKKDYPIPMFEKDPSTSYFLVHLATHLAYHLGQINYHRRFFDQ